MRILQDTSLSMPVREYLVAFSVARAAAASASRRTIIVKASSPSDAKKICRRRYPRGMHVQVFDGPAPSRR